MDYLEFIEKLNTGGMGDNLVFRVSRSSGTTTFEPIVLGKDYIPNIGSYDNAATFQWGQKYVILIGRNIDLNHFRFDTTDNYSWLVSASRNDEIARYRFPWSRSIMVYPEKMVKILGYDKVALNPFQIHGYHASGMRTNVGNVATRDLLFSPKDTTFELDTMLGFEIETCGLTSDALAVIDDFFCDRANFDVFSHFDVSHDSSLNGRGAELVSLPMSYNYLMDNRAIFDKVYKWMLSSGLNQRGSSMHIHFDRRFINNLVRDGGQKYLNYVWSNGNNLTRLVDIIVGRKETDYCKYRPIESGGGIPVYHHHNWISATDRTVEIRRYGANLNTDDLLLKLDFTMDIFKTINLIKTKDLPLTEARKLLTIMVQKYYLKKLNLIKELVYSQDIDYSGIFEWWTALGKKTTIENYITREEGVMEELLLGGIVATARTTDDTTSLD